MIEITKMDVSGWEAALRGMRNPLNSWDKSDTVFQLVGHSDTKRWNVEAIIGSNDLKLMRSLVSAGSDHRKFLRMINVTANVIAPFYWWKEYDTYKIGTVANSCSTMHTIHTKDFTFSDFSCEKLDDFGKNNLQNIINYLNFSRKMYCETQDKTYWYHMIQILPSSYNQLRTIQVNYEVLRNIYHSRKNHKLDEWRDFCRWIEHLPYSELISDLNTKGE